MATKKTDLKGTHADDIITPVVKGIKTSAAAVKKKTAPARAKIKDYVKKTSKKAKVFINTLGDKNARKYYNNDYEEGT